MKAINLYTLTRVCDSLISSYENINSKRDLQKKFKEHEIVSLSALVEQLIAKGLGVSDFDGFFFSYTIEHISKEFDLIRLSGDKSSILNIELKSTDVAQSKIEKQLRQNLYYLRHIAKDIRSYTYVSSSNTLYKLDVSQIDPQDDDAYHYTSYSAYKNEEYGLSDPDEKKSYLREASLNDLIEDMKLSQKAFNGDIDPFFKAPDYLISPLSTPERFISGQYFLTNQQNTFLIDIMKASEKVTPDIYTPRPVLISITGSAGTGKTLLLYTVARELAKTKRVVIIHCGLLSDNHIYLKENIENLNIIPICDIHSLSFMKVNVILVDEAQRLYPGQLKYIRKYIKEYKAPGIFSYDDKQILTTSELMSDTSSELFEISDIRCNLSGRIRSNPDIADFIDILFSRSNASGTHNFDCVHLEYANNKDESENILNYYKDKGFVYIYMQEDKNIKADMILPNNSKISQISATMVLGQEFNSVVMIMGDEFFFEDGELKAKPHPSHDYIYTKLLSQGLSRAREDLTIIVLNNLKVFKTLLEIKSL